MPVPLVVVDVQQAFDLVPEAFGGRRDNPGCDAAITALVRAWQDRGAPIVLVRHDSVTPGSPLAPGQPGNALKPLLRDVEPALLVTKSVNSGFLGEPDLAAWLRGGGHDAFVLCGITTNHCVETTARMGANLGFGVTLVPDACHTFDRVGPDGATVTAEALTRASLASLHGEFATIARLDDVL